MSTNNVKNTVTVRGANTNYATSSVQVPVSSENVNITVSKAYYAPNVPKGGSIYSGDIIVFQIIITNTSTTEVARNITVSDSCDTGITFDNYSIDNPSGAIITSEVKTDTTLSFTIVSLVANSKVTVTIYSHVN